LPGARRAGAAVRDVDRAKAETLAAAGRGFDDQDDRRPAVLREAALGASLRRAEADARPARARVQALAGKAEWATQIPPARRKRATCWSTRPRGSFAISQNRRQSCTRRTMLGGRSCGARSKRQG